MPTVPSMTEIGYTGLQHSGGVIREEWLRALDGATGVATYAEMATDAVVGAMLYAIGSKLLGTEWKVNPADESTEASKIAEFVESCMDDMSSTWGDFIAEALTMLPFGWSYFETVYKVRKGQTDGDPGASSKYSDGWIGWRKHSIRAQETLNRWDLDDQGGVQGMWQSQQWRPGASGREVLLPIQKCLLFRPSAHKGNPQGRSVLRTAYVPWYYRKRTTEIAAINVERDLVGLPYGRVPAEWMTESATGEVKAALAAMEKILSQIRNDEQGYFLWPSAFDGNGNQMFEIGLLGSPGAKTVDVEARVRSLNAEITMTALADVILIGHESVGSFSLSEQKYDAFTEGLMGWLSSVAAVLNRHAVPRLLKLNDIDLALCPEIAPDPVETVDLAKLGAYIKALSDTGFPLYPQEELQAHLAAVAGLPYTPMEERETLEKPGWEIPADQQTPGAPPGAPQPRGSAPQGTPPANAQDAQVGKFNPNHDARGRFAARPGGAGGALAAGGPSSGPAAVLARHVEGGSGSAGDPYRTRDVDTAIELLGQGHHVRLHQPDEVATMVDKLAAIVQDAKAKGTQAPVYDLCKVSVPGTNLFCKESKHVPRNMMPQLSGKPTPGSWADRNLPKNAKGEVDLAKPFEAMLARRGIAVTAEQRPASHLRASQNQLNGAKVAGMSKALDRGELPPGSIYVTRDGYVIDGHHRWAANVASGITRGADMSMDVKVIDEDILQVLAIANNFATGHGVPKAGVAKADVLATLAALARWEEGRQTSPFGELAKMNPHHDRLGRFASAGTGGALEPIVADPRTKNPGAPAAVSLEGLDARTTAAVGESWRKATGLDPDAVEGNLKAVFREALADGPAVEEGRRWYGDAHRDAEALAAKHQVRPETAVGVVAALSPGAEWGANKRMADAILTSAGRHPDLDAERLAHVAKAEHHLSVPHGYDPLIKASRIAKGEAPGDVLTGAKVRSFYNNIRDPSDPAHITIDSHILDAAYGGTRRGAAGILVETPKAKVVEYMTNRGMSGELPKDWRAQTPAGADFVARNPVFSQLTGSPKSGGRTVGTLPLAADAIRSITAEHNAAHPEVPLLPHQTQAIIWTHWIKVHPPTESRAATNAAVAATGEYYGGQA